MNLNVVSLYGIELCCQLLHLTSSQCMQLAIVGIHVLIVLLETTV